MFNNKEQTDSVSDWMVNIVDFPQKLVETKDSQVDRNTKIGNKGKQLAYSAEKIHLLAPLNVTTLFCLFNLYKKQSVEMTHQLVVVVL